MELGGGAFIASCVDVSVNPRASTCMLTSNNVVLLVLLDRAYYP